MTIDNFEIFRNHLTFIDKTDRYIIHILRRPKDCVAGENYLGSNEHQRLIRTYYIDNIDYYNKKETAIKELCHANNARAYIIPQVRNNYECLLNLGEKVLETIRLGNYSVKPEHLLRSAYCEYHKSRAKRWIIDLDDDCMIEYKRIMNFPRDKIQLVPWDETNVLKLIRENLVKCGKKESDAYCVPTKSGYHIITEPFNLNEALTECSLMYEGIKNTLVSYDDNDKPVYKQITGWLHKDGMSLLYYHKEAIKS